MIGTGSASLAGPSGGQFAEGPAFYCDLVARKDTVLVYDSDPRWYITAEVDDPVRPTRRWYRLWWESIAHAYTRSQDPDELRQMIEGAGLDPLGWRQPTVEERQPRRNE